MCFRSGFLFLLLIMSPTPLLAKDFSPDPIIRGYVIVSQMMKRCPRITSDAPLIAMKNKVDHFGQFLVESLAMRASNITPGVSTEAAVGQIRLWLDDQTSKISNHQLCNMATNKQVREIINSILTDAAQTEISRYAARPFKGVILGDLKSNPVLQTYALPRFQEIARKTIADSHAQLQCQFADISDIKLLHKQQSNVRNLPIYIERPVQITEQWGYSCGGKTGAVELVYSRNSHHMIGNYRIQDK